MEGFQWFQWIIRADERLGAPVHHRYIAEVNPVQVAFGRDEATAAFVIVLALVVSFRARFVVHRGSHGRVAFYSDLLGRQWCYWF